MSNQLGPELQSPLETLLPNQISELFNPQTIRVRSRKIYDYILKGQGHFIVRESKLAECADYVTKVTRDNYPDLNIPIHGRWNHFKVQGVDYLAPLQAQIKNLPATQRAQALWDLCLVSVLLDAGAGNSWAYTVPQSSLKIGRSEGLALASLFMFTDGLFSNDKHNPYRVDAKALSALTLNQLERAFQVTPSNPLVGLEGRLHLLKALGHTIEQSHYFDQRPSDIFLTLADQEELCARDILQACLLGLGPIWPSRLTLDGMSLGDVWEYPPLDFLIPFHKLSQWLSYSMIGPYEILHKKVWALHDLTGLPEYRNGGLFLDFGVIELKDPAMATTTHRASDPLIIEWRALTIVLLDQVADLVRLKLGKAEDELSLASVLEGGTWHAGRRLASQKRGPSAPPPLQLQSDGTVF